MRTGPGEIGNCSTFIQGVIVCRSSLEQRGLGDRAEGWSVAAKGIVRDEDVRFCC